MTTKFLEIDRPTGKGTIYPRAVVEEAIALFIEKFRERSPELPPKFPLYKRATLQPDLKDMVGLIDDVRIEDGYLVGDVAFLQSYLDEEIGKGSKTFCIRPIGLGAINPETNVIEPGYKIIGMAVVTPKTS